MRYLIPSLGALLVGCSMTAPPQDAAQSGAPAVANEPGTDAAAVDSLAILRNRWEVVRIDSVIFPDKQAFVHFQADGFFSHEAGCGGGHPAFYDASSDGALSTSRREAVTIGKCIDARAATLERMLADFVDRANGWSMPEPGRLVLTSSDGRPPICACPSGRFRRLRESGGCFRSEAVPGAGPSRPRCQ